MDELYKVLYVLRKRRKVLHKEPVHLSNVRAYPGLAGLQFTFELTHYEHYSSYYFCFRVEILYVVMLVTFKSFYSTYWFSLYLYLLTLFLVSVYIVYPEFLCIPLCLPSPVPGHIYPKVQK